MPVAEFDVWLEATSPLRLPPLPPPRHPRQHDPVVPLHALDVLLHKCDNAMECARSMATDESSLLDDDAAAEEAPAPGEVVSRIDVSDGSSCCLDGCS